MYTHTVNTCRSANVTTFERANKTICLHTLRSEMPRKANEFAVKWLESKDAGKINRVNVKHILGHCGEIAEGREVVVKLNLRRYRCTVIELLDWAPPKKNAPFAFQSKGKDKKR